MRSKVTQRRHVADLIEAALRPRRESASDSKPVPHLARLYLTYLTPDAYEWNIGVTIPIELLSIEMLMYWEVL